MAFIRTSFILLVCFTISTNLQAKYQTNILSTHIKTLMVHREGWPLSEAIIGLEGPDRITISFDDLHPDESEYMYTLIHCNADWEKSMLSKMEYVFGFSENYFNNYDYSFNTNINYLHYRVTLPNDDMRMTKSGNYALVVYESDNPEKIVCTACFRVVDYKVVIEPFIDFNTMVDIKKTTQQINFTIKHPDLYIDNVIAETKVFVQQNNRTDNEVTNIPPTFTRPGLLMYEENVNLIFKGGNEYRHFDGVSTRFYGEGVENIEYFNPYYHLTLYPEEIMGQKPYLFKYDHNGKFFIRRQEADQTALDLESDYMFVHFSIPMKDPILTGEIFLSGAFTNNVFDESTKMIYNFKEKAYQSTHLLKQGYYNYKYFFRPTNSRLLESKPIENDFYETENDYSIFFYYRPQAGRYDQLVGYVKFNSVKRL